MAAYSTRARAGASVSTAIAWEELPSIRSGNQFRVANLTARLSYLIDDPWADFAMTDQVVPVSKRRRSCPSGQVSRSFAMIAGISARSSRAGTVNLTE
jgi:DNA primase